LFYSNSDRTMSFGALVAAMIATSGDEAFVVLSMFPLQAIGLSVMLFVIAIAAGRAAENCLQNRNTF